MNKHDLTVHLEISSWQGVSIGAQHYYGKLTGYIDGEYTSVEVMHPMSKEMADELNAKDDWDGYEEGTETIRFDTEEEIRKRALETWREHFPSAIMLFEGSGSYVEPKKCLACPYEKAMNVFNRTFEWWEKMDDLKFPLEHPDRDRANEIFDKMKEIVEKE